MSGQKPHHQSDPPIRPSAPGATHTVTGDGQQQLVLVKNGQRYVFRYAPGDETGLLESLIEMARDPQSDLTWFDAAMLSHQMGQQFGKKIDQMVNQ